MPEQNITLPAQSMITVVHNETKQTYLSVADLRAYLYKAAALNSEIPLVKQTLTMFAELIEGLKPIA